MATANLTGIQASVLALVALASSGCISMGQVSNSLSDLLVPNTSAAAAASGPRVSVVVKKQESAARVVELPWQENMLVHDALKQSGAYREFRRPKIRIVRKNPHGGGEHALGVDYDRSLGRVPEVANYVLWDGDRVIVEKEDISMATEVLDSTLGPIGRLVRRR